MALQTKTGKAFEYSLLLEFYDRLREITDIKIIENDSFITAKDCFDDFSDRAKDSYRINASIAVNFLIDVEPRLSHGLDQNDILQIEIASDFLGQSGDVRDVLLIRNIQKWEIGVSAKNNHKAVKHSRLSATIDFGEKWLGLPCSSTYFKEINKVFSMLNKIKKEDKTSRWDSIENMHEVVYLPILKAFRDELLRLNSKDSNIVAAKLVEYLIGNKDFYKVIKSNNQVEIQAFNIHGLLNLPFKNIKPKAKIPKVKLPTRLIEVVFENNSSTTLAVHLNHGWQISFRIHSAKATVEPSLKFDINLISKPESLFVTHTHTLV